MKRLLFFAAAMTAVMTGCSNEELISVQEGNAISFRAVTDMGGEETRAMEVTTATLKNFVVGAAYYGSASTTFIDNVTATRNVAANTYSYAPKAYMPTSMLDADKIGFHAYSPAGTQNVKAALAVTAATGAAASSATLSYTVPLNGSVAGSDQEDFLVASTDIVKSASGSGAVAFTFKHALAMFKIAAKNQSPGTTLNITAVKLYKFKNAGKLSLPMGATAASWTATGDAGTYIMAIPGAGFSLPGSTSTSFTTFNTNSEGLMVLPQQLAINATPSATTSSVGITYEVKDASGFIIVPSKEFFYTLSPSAAYSIDPGKVYTLQLTYNAGTAISFSATVGNWSDATALGVQ